VSGKQYYARTATTVAHVLQKGGANIQTVINRVVITATTAGTVAFTDGTVTYTIDVVAGVNAPFHFPMIFKPGGDVTITPTGPTASVFADYSQK
jgi:hypothetical protein